MVNLEIQKSISAPPSRVLGVARFVSLIGHPMVLLTLTITLVLARNLPPARLVTIVGIFLLSTIIPLCLVMWRKVASGQWTNMDVSDPDQRGHLYSAAIVIIALATLMFWLMSLPHTLFIGSVVSLLLLVSGMLVSRRSKISMHTMFAAYCAVALLGVSIAFSFVLIVMVGLVAWSRLVLKRHTASQVIGGLCLGICAGVLLIWLV
jgi:membrane-associated phospholipid phosphatase